MANEDTNTITREELRRYKGTASLLYIGDGQDQDWDIVEVDVTGDPKIIWNELADAFDFSKPITDVKLLDPEITTDALETAGISVDTWYDVATGVGFENSWVNFGSPFANAAYRIDYTGKVTLKGEIKSGTIGSVAAFTLPELFRPPTRIILPAVVSNSILGRVDAIVSGEIFIVQGSNVAVPLDGLSFYTN